MPRPNLISRLHELRYELWRPRLEEQEIINLQAECDALLERACAEYQCAKVELLRVLARDFGKWVRDERLPWMVDDEEER